MFTRGSLNWEASVNSHAKSPALTLLLVRVVVASIFLW